MRGRCCSSRSRRSRSCRWNASSPRTRAPRRRFATDVAFATFGQVLVRAGAGAGRRRAAGAAGRRRARAPAARATSSAIAGARFVPDIAGRPAAVRARRLRATTGWRTRVPALWRLHEIHHSSETMDWLASFRQHPLEILLHDAGAERAARAAGRAAGRARDRAGRCSSWRPCSCIRTCACRSGRCASSSRRRAFIIATTSAAARSRNFASLLPFIDVVFGSYSAADQPSTFGVERALPDGFVALLLEPLRRRDR